MNKSGWILTLRSWMGMMAVLAAGAAAVWLLSVYIHARIVDPQNAARIEAL